jgi:catechol 2,3-dioxygenase-like lactoylglutathione lyase family enzyme
VAITGAHVLLYTVDPDADRAFLRDVLGFRSVDAGHGWLIFALPPSELAVHPTEDKSAPAGMVSAVLYLMCDDVRGTVQSLESKGVSCTPLASERWGIRTSFRLPSGGEVGLYQPTHPTAIGLS